MGERGLRHLKNECYDGLNSGKIIGIRRGEDFVCEKKIFIR